MLCATNQALLLPTTQITRWILFFGTRYLFQAILTCCWTWTESRTRLKLPVRKFCCIISLTSIPACRSSVPWQSQLYLLHCHGSEEIVPNSLWCTYCCVTFRGYWISNDHQLTWFKVFDSVPSCQRNLLFWDGGSATPDCCIKLLDEFHIIELYCCNPWLYSLGFLRHCWYTLTHHLPFVLVSYFQWTCNKLLENHLAISALHLFSLIK